VAEARKDGCELRRGVLNRFPGSWWDGEVLQEAAKTYWFSTQKMVVKHGSLTLNMNTWWFNNDKPKNPKHGEVHQQKWDRRTAFRTARTDPLLQEVGYLGDEPWMKPYEKH